ncbi:MAG: RNA polymerase sigma factor RpoH [Rhodospirillales bacterium]|nr:RNA polymerase sigma factor RpoH [Rhodospirillales bacterium]
MTAISLPTVPVEGGLSLYFREAWRFPMLEADEEFMLAKRWREHEDVDAAHALVTSHLRLVCKMAMKYRGYGLPVADLISEGNIGLMKAVRKFEPDRGFRLSTYAIWWIRASITEYILKSWSMVKLGTVSAQKKLFFSLRRTKSQLKILDDCDLTPEQADQLSERLGVPADDIVAMNRRLAARDTSLNVPMGDDEGMEFQDTLKDEALSPEMAFAESEELSLRGGFLKTAVAALPERERHIFTERNLSEEPKTLEELGQYYGVSRERVRQLEARAMERVQKAVLDAAENAGAV